MKYDAFSHDVLDTLCPMHVRVNQTGHITHAAPTVRKLRPERPWLGERFLEVFWPFRPHDIRTMQDLRNAMGRKLSLEMRDPPGTRLKGLAVAGGPSGELVVNLAFGFTIAEDIARLSLSNSDFAATDMTMEMLYLVEAHGAVRKASQDLNRKLQEAKAKAEHQASTDMLTGLQNRRAFEIALTRMIAGSAPLTLMQIDLDHFKAVNDTLGHAAGDYVLTEVADIFRDVLRKNDHAARIGGDEFVVSLPRTTCQATIRELGEALLKRLQQPIMFNGHACNISGSIGAVIWDGKRPTSIETLMDDGDIALYASKNGGRAQLTFYEPHLREDVQASDQEGRSVELW